MAVLNGYRHFIGRHWETGSVCNAYAYRGVNAPHTGEPYSEALLLGISGGIVIGYFSFAYQGYDPHVAILTRNTFDPLDTLLERLGVVQQIQQTARPAQGLANLLETLESGLPALVWADVFSLPYNGLARDEGMWQMYPILVYGYDAAQDTVWIADRARVPLAVTTTELAAARARVKKDKFRVLSLGAPDPRKLASAVHKGIWDTLKLFTDRPPKGSPENFGFAAYHRWAELLVNSKPKNSWAKVFPPGRPLVAGLTAAFFSIIQNNPEADAERLAYAAFLDEARQILEKPALAEAAQLFRRSAQVWKELAAALLPGEVPLLAELRALMVRQQQAFLEAGGAALPDILAAGRRLEDLKKESAADFPLAPDEIRRLLEGLREQVLRVSEVERAAVVALQAAMVEG